MNRIAVLPLTQANYSFIRTINDTQDKVKVISVYAPSGIGMTMSDLGRFRNRSDSTITVYEHVTESNLEWDICLVLVDDIEPVLFVMVIHQSCC